eukprot:COSAG02_NODE_2526_length_8605_cov_3.359746_6_plen_92_part_00
MLLMLWLLGLRIYNWHVLQLVLVVLARWPQSRCNSRSRITNWLSIVLIVIVLLFPRVGVLCILFSADAAFCFLSSGCVPLTGARVVVKVRE